MLWPARRPTLDQNRSVRDFVAPDWALVNARLATHYGLAEVHGFALREVPLPADAPFGGVWTQAATMKVTANGTLTSPVKRGVTGVFREKYREVDPEFASLPQNQRAGHKPWRDGLPVDCTGSTPDGRAFASVVELRRTPAANPEQLARGVTRHMLTFATAAPAMQVVRAAVVRFDLDQTNIGDSPGGSSLDGHQVNSPISGKLHIDDFIAAQS